ncbi:hypothetical protein KACHI17_09990 [Sediminibacterium sp. KACHI17]|uniref:DUF3108 domain-containing protein n=1 Tax=Sediminibacterium sp. KACHI17 TaxID=1751071 RepID=A0AAT9GHW3_9BACT
MKVCMAIAFVCFVIPSFSQKDTVALGKGFRASAPLAYKSDYLQVWRMPDGTARMPLFASKSVELLTFNNTPTWALIQQYRKEKTVDRDTTYFDEKTLQPLAYRTNLPSEGYSENVSFTKDLITVQIQYKDSSKVISYPVSGGYIQATMMDYLISKLPLQKGYSTSFRSVNAGSHFDEMITTITVTDKEDLVFSSSMSIPCWKVEVITGKSKSWQWYSVAEQSLMKLELGSKERALFVKSRIL